jgi:NMD protein affecting ribosome stability and mRNA decay
MENHIEEQRKPWIICFECGKTIEQGDAIYPIRKEGMLCKKCSGINKNSEKIGQIEIDFDSLDKK